MLLKAYALSVIGSAMGRQFCTCVYGCNIIESNLTLKLVGPKPNNFELATTPFLIRSLWF